MMNLSAYFPLAAYTIAPEDVLAHKVRNLLAADERLLAIFTAERIETVPALGLPDRRAGMRLMVAPGDVDEQGGPTNVDTANVRIILRISYQLPKDQWDPLYSGASEVLTYPFGVPTLATLVRHILRLLKQDETLLQRMPNGSTEKLTDGAIFGPFTNSQDPPDPNVESMRYYRDIVVTYRVPLVHRGEHSGKIESVYENGG